MRKLITIAIIGIVLMGIAYLLLVKVSETVCDKPFSNEFKQTQEYRDLQCT